MFKDFSIYNISIIIPVIGGFLLLPIYTNYLTIEDYGIRAIILIGFIFFQVISDFGSGWVIRSKFFSISNKNELSSYISTLLLITLIVRLVSVAFLYTFGNNLFSNVFKDWSNVHFKLFQLQLVIFLLDFIRNLAITVIILNKNSTKYVLITLSKYATTTLCSLYLLIIVKTGIASLFYGEIIGSVVFVLFSMLILKDYLSIKLSNQVFKDIIKIGLPAVPKNIISQIQLNINKYFIQLYLPIGQLGLFQKSEFLYKGFIGLQKSFANTVSPDNIKLIVKKEKDIVTGSLSISFIYLISIILVFCIFYLKHLFIIIGVNEAFLPAADYAPLFAMNVLISSYAIMFVNNILISEKTYYFTIRTVLAGIFNIGANIILIPKFGIIGGVIAVIIGSSVSIIIEIYVSEVVLYSRTLINYWLWLTIILITLLIYVFNHQIIFSPIQKLLIVFSYVFSLLLLDNYFVKAINWDKIKNKIVITS